MLKLVIILISVFVLFVVLRLAIGFFSANRVATGLVSIDGENPTLSGCDGLLNCTSSTASAKDNQVEPLAYQSESGDVIKLVADLIAKQKGVNIETQTNNYLHATYKTKLMGYIDDLELLLDENSGELHIRSASRIGKSDLGANRKRIELLRSEVQGKI